MPFKGKGSIQNPYANQVNNLQVQINRDKIVKEESVTKNIKSFKIKQ